MVVLGSVLLCAAPASAAGDPPGAAALRQARAAWDRGSLESAESSYKEALAQGGLAPAETLEGYIRLGAIRAALGRKESSLASFRAASILDDSFSVPSEGGKRAITWAARAKKDTAKIGAIQLALQVPKGDLPAGKSFKVTATLDKKHVSIVKQVGVVAKDGTTGKEITLDAKPEESVDFEIPAEITLPGASILVRVDALDGHKNRVASAEERVRVPEDAAPVIAKDPTPPPASKTKVVVASTKPPGADQPRRGSFWSSPWPYLIGGVALAGAGAAVYFGTRPAENVSVGSPGIKSQ